MLRRQTSTLVPHLRFHVEGCFDEVCPLGGSRLARYVVGLVGIYDENVTQIGNGLNDIKMGSAQKISQLQNHALFSQRKPTFETRCRRSNPLSFRSPVIPTAFNQSSYRRWLPLLAGESQEIVLLLKKSVMSKAVSQVGALQCTSHCCRGLATSYCVDHLIGTGVQRTKNKPHHVYLPVSVSLTQFIDSPQWLAQLLKVLLCEPIKSDLAFHWLVAFQTHSQVCANADEVEALRMSCLASRMPDY